MTDSPPSAGIVPPTAPASSPTEPPLGERVARLEAMAAEERRSWSGRASKSMSLAALIISLIAGSYGLVDSFYLARQREAEKAADEIRQIVRRITEINSQFTPLLLRGDHATAVALSSVVNGEKLPILVRAEELIRKHGIGPGIVDPGSLLVLSGEQLNFANNKLALDYAIHAAALARDNRILQAEALRYQARARFAPGPDQDRTTARGAFQQARDAVQNFSSYMSQAVEMNILGDWLLAEASFGNCADAKKVAAELLAQARSARLPGAQVQAMLDNLKKNPWLGGACAVF